MWRTFFLGVEADFFFPTDFSPDWLVSEVEGTESCIGVWLDELQLETASIVEDWGVMARLADEGVKRDSSCPELSLLDISLWVSSALSGALLGPLDDIVQ